MNKKPYEHNRLIHNTQAAEHILPVLQKFLNFSSVIDLGCGLGSWLYAAKQLGVERILGIDGDFVPRDLLYIDQKHFVVKDLKVPEGLVFQEKYDLALCLEVAEHLPMSISENIIDFLADSADNILFSAAIPGQRGQNHINEQWPDFWASKFRNKGLYTYDFLRPIIWHNNDIEWWYRQNIFFVSKHNFLTNGYSPCDLILPLVHPQNYNEKMIRLSNYEKGKVSLTTAFGTIAKKIMSELR